MAEEENTVETQEEESILDKVLDFAESYTDVVEKITDFGADFVVEKEFELIAEKVADTSSTLDDKLADSYFYASFVKAYPLMTEEKKAEALAELGLKVAE